MDKTFTTYLVVVLIIVGYALLLAAIVYLHIRLAKNPNKKLGYILPAIFFISSILYVINRNTDLTRLVQDNQGRFVEVTFNQPSYLTTISEFLVANIPTIALLLITFYIHDQIRREIELKNMKVHDL